MIYHPIEEKNRGLKQKFEAFAELVDKKELLVGMYNGVNESDTFVHDLKLPAILYFN